MSSYLRLLACFVTSVASCAFAFGQAGPSSGPTTAAIRPASPVEIRVTNLPPQLKVAQPCKVTLTFKNTLAMPVSLQTLKHQPNLHLKVWCNGERKPLPFLPPADGQAVLKPGESLTTELDLAASGLTRQAGHYLIALDVVSFLVDETEKGRPPVPILVTTQLQYVVQEPESR